MSYNPDKFNPSNQMRNAGIVAMFDDRVPVPKISKKYRLTRQSIYTILRANDRQPGKNRTDRSAHETLTNAQIAERFKRDNQSYLRAIFTAHANRGTMPPHMTPVAFYVQLEKLKITIPHDLQGTAI